MSGIIKVVSIVVALVILIGLLSIYYFKPSENELIEHILKNPEKSAIKLVRNGEEIVNHNSSKMMPLASTVKMVIAIEYACQTAAGMIDPEEGVSLAELQKYYIPNTDGNAHKDWLEYISKNQTRNQISIQDVAKGMIWFSSNANAEWLSHKLGLENINHRLDSLEVTDHSEIYYISSAMMIAKEVFPELSDDELVGKLRSLSNKEYMNYSARIHDKLTQNQFDKSDINQLSNMAIQRVWSDRLPASSVSEYCEILKKLNSKSYFNPLVHQYLDPIFELAMNNPKNQGWLQHSGSKGGSTAFVLTEAMYATDKEGNTTELAFFMDDLSMFKNIKLQTSINQFELNILTNDEFISELRNLTFVKE